MRKRQVRRYPLVLGDTTLELALNTKLLHFGWQEARGGFSLWVEETSEDAPGTRKRTFRVVPTGAEWPDRGPGEFTHVGTTIFPDGYHVFHLYEVL